MVCWNEGPLLKEHWRLTVELLCELGWEKISGGDCMSMYSKAEQLSDTVEDVREVPRRTLQVGHSLTKRDMSSFGTLEC